MAWTIEYDPRAVEELRQLDPGVRRTIVRYPDTRVAMADDPRAFGRALRHDLGGLWRYRVGDYRVICQVRDAALTVLVIGVGHRREVYL